MPCRAKQHAAVEVLLPATIDAQSSSGCTALYLAAEAGDQAIVRRLLVAGANVALAASDGSPPLMQACRFGHEQCALALIKAGANLEAQIISSGHTALMLSCQNGYELCARALIEAGADTSKAVSGWTALMFAKHYGHTAICELLEATSISSRNTIRKKRYVC